MPTEKYGQVITFYSYKGGTGRTMALANVACLLARKSSIKKGILMIDWDLEAPGLHRFFYPKSNNKIAGEIDPTFEGLPGLIDLFYEFDKLDATNADLENGFGETVKKMLTGKKPPYIQKTDISKVFLLKAGKFDADYPSRVNSFKWDKFFKKYPWLFRAFAEELSKIFDYVLIDSRTGITDTSGICTMIMPEKLVVVFVPNHQSLTGIAELVKRAVEYRKLSDDLRSLIVFPLSSRIEANEADLLREWRYGNKEKKVVGYQPLFENLFLDTYQLSKCNLDDYFTAIKIKQMPYYAYGEEISVLRDSTDDDLYPAFGYNKFVEAVSYLTGPWDYNATTLGKRSNSYGGQNVITGAKDLVWEDNKIKQATATYLDYLLARHQYLTMKGMGTAENIPMKLKLLDLYVPLHARREVPKGETWERQLKLAGRKLDNEEDTKATRTLRLGEPEPVLEILKENDGVIILGDPGAGKTAFLKFLALKLASGEGADLGLEGRLPIILPLAAYANALQKSDVRLDDFIAGYFNDIGVDFPIGAMLANSLDSGHALVLLDGLDEITDISLRNTVMDRVINFYASHCRKHNKFILTSRVVGYRSVRIVAEGMVECTLVDFDDDAITEFITKWTVTIEKQALGDTIVAHREAETECRELLDAMRSNAGVRSLAANPLLLTILALMKRKGVTLPDRRVQLYDQYIITLLSTWNRARSLSGRAPGRDLDEVQTTRVLAPLALWMHEINPGVGLVKRADLHRKLKEIFTARYEPDPEAATRQFMQDVREYASILLERGPEEFGFIHLTFEEYLAAMALASVAQGNAQLVLEALIPHIGEQAWREVALLAVSYIGIRQNLPHVAGAVVEGLAKARIGEPSEAVVLAGEAVLDAWPDGVTAESKDRVTEELIPAMQNPDAKPSLRRQAGLVLGRLGWKPTDLDDFLEIAPGKFVYGDKKEGEEREIKYRYWMAKYPVTNLQYARFIQDDGYGKKEWWSNEGIKWLKEKNRIEPDRWLDQQFNNPIFPVVSVSWFEAQAYCRWLSVQSLGSEVPDGYTFRLVTDDEWERAAYFKKGKDDLLGNNFDIKFVNTAESDRMGTTAVCTYPLGKSKEGIWDMYGNVWEWSESWYDAKRGTRVLRGGSWNFTGKKSHFSYRRGENPNYFYYSLGFRVTISRAIYD